MLKDFNEKLLEYQDQLNRKEYIIQSIEKKYFKCVDLLKQYCINDPKLRMQLKELQINCLEEKKISNVVEENEELKNKMKKYEEKINILENRLEQFSTNDSLKQGGWGFRNINNNSIKLEITDSNRNPNSREDKNECISKKIIEIKSSNKKSLNLKHKIEKLNKKLLDYSETVFRFIDLFLVINSINKITKEEYRVDLHKDDEKKKENLENEAYKLIDKIKNQINKDLDLNQEFSFYDLDYDHQQFNIMNKKCNDISSINPDNEDEFGGAKDNNLSNFSDCLELPIFIENKNKKNTEI